MRKPLIGITAHTLLEGIKESGRPGDIDNALSQAYVDAIDKAGGIPIIVPLLSDPQAIEDISRNLDGILLSGGGDIDPALFGEEPHPALRVVDCAKDQLEKTLLAKVLPQDMPILGICRGMQILNVIAGGTLIQDIPSSSSTHIGHLQRATEPSPTHTIRIQEGSLLKKIFGQSTLRVNSYHHQAVQKIAPGFAITAEASDGIIEAIESKQHRFVLGVQFHPEMMFQDFPIFQKIFQAFVAAAAAKATAEKLQVQKG